MAQDDDQPAGGVVHDQREPSEEAFEKLIADRQDFLVSCKCGVWRK